MATAVATAIVSSAGLTGVAATVATFAISAVVSAGMSMVTRSLFGSKPDAAGWKVEERDLIQVIRSSTAPRRVVYGQARTSGPLVFAATTGSKKEFLHLVVPVGHGGEYEEIGDIYFGDRLSTHARYSGKRRVNKALGAADQAADSDLVSEVAAWTINHRLRGIPYVYTRLRWNQKAFATGIPNISAVVKGRKVYDPRDGAQDVDDASTWTYSNNAALCVLDYMRADFGINAANDEIDFTSFIAAANVCDEDVALDAASPVTTQKRYTCDGVLFLDGTRKQNLEKLLTSCAGALVYTQGTYKLFPSAYTTPVISLDESDLAGDVTVRPELPRGELFNRVRGLFVDATQFWQRTDFPAVENATYEAEDAETITREIELPFTTDATRAQRLAKIHLERSRQAITVDLECKMTALQVAVMESIQLSIEELGWTNKVFTPQSWAKTEKGTIRLVLQEEASTSYDWAFGDATTLDAAPDTDLPDPFTVANPTVLTLTSGAAVYDIAGDGTVLNYIKASWTAPADEYVQSGGRIEVQYKKSDDAAWLDAPAVDGADTETLVGPLQDGIDYDVHIRSVNALRVPADTWVQSSDHTLVGKASNPSDVASLFVQQSGANVLFKWPPITDAGRDGYGIHYGPRGAFNFDDATPISPELIARGTTITTAAVPPGDWTFGIKAYDTSDNASLNAATVDLVVTNAYDVVVEQAEADPWGGTLTNMLRHWTGVLVPDSQTLASAMSDAELWDQLCFNPYTNCYYEGEEIDLGFDATDVRVWGDITSVLGPGESGFADPDFQVDYKLSAGSYDGFEDWLAGTLSGRYVKPRIYVDTAHASGVPVISALKTTLDVAERAEVHAGEAIAASGTIITFDQRFHLVPNIEVSVEGTTALLATYTNVTATSVKIHVWNVSGTDVGGTVTVRATGA